jgi:hypothetical protein
METNMLFTTAGVVLAYAVTRDAAIAISDFARRPVMWGSELIGQKHLK